LPVSARGHLLTGQGLPRLREEEVEPYTVDEVRRILQAAGELRTSARWAVALALGLRQGEALALRWPDVDLDTGTLFVRRSRLRPKWLHGCEMPCGRKYPGYCPQRIPAREESVETKSRAGRRRIGLPDELVSLLRKHRDEQDRERELAGQLWTRAAGSSRRPPAGR
jgi:integrase